MANLAFLKFAMTKVLENIHTVSNVKKNIVQLKIFQDIALFLFIIFEVHQMESSIKSP